jgi:YD repeat-containing protein
MQIQYQPKTNVMYIQLSDRPVAYTKQPDADTALDYDEQGNLIGIELLNVSTQVSSPSEILFQYAPDAQISRADLPTTEEALARRKKQPE